MTEPTEAEVEAAARAIDPWGFDPDNQSINSRAYRQGMAREQARAALTAAAQVRERVAAPAWDAPHNRYCAAVEEMAMKIYAGFEYTGTGKKPAWTPHGNATMQDHARALARRQLLPIYSATEDQG